MENKQKDEHATHALYWEKLSQSDPQEVCKRTQATFSEEQKGYILPILNLKYLIVPGELKIFCLRGDLCVEEKYRDYFFLMALLYLLNAREGEPSRQWISEKELKGGTTFFRGPHALRTDEIRQAFGKDPAKFLRAGEGLGGTKLLFGDNAFALNVFPKVPIGLVLWKEDEEFPSQVTVLFDSTIQNHFSLDGIWCLVAEISERLLEVHRK
jgi:hypothetical protein